MRVLLRVIFVVSLMLLTMQGAGAHVRNRGSDTPRIAVADQSSRTAGPSHEALHDAACMPMGADPVPGPGPRDRHHHGCLCCTTSCGVHCGALVDASRMAIPALGPAALPPSRPDAHDDGVSHAPPVRPPIA
jgi:hypothetical protein